MRRLCFQHTMRIGTKSSQHLRQVCEAAGRAGLPALFAAAQALVQRPGEDAGYM
jgi:hypothetical protein